MASRVAALPADHGSTAVVPVGAVYWGNGDGDMTEAEIDALFRDPAHRQRDQRSGSGRTDRRGRRRRHSAPRSRSSRRHPARPHRRQGHPMSDPGFTPATDAQIWPWPRPTAHWPRRPLSRPGRPRASDVEDSRGHAR